MEKHNVIELAGRGPIVDPLIDVLRVGAMNQFRVPMSPVGSM